MVVLSYCAPLELRRAMIEPQGASVDVLAVVAAVADSDRTPWYPHEVREIALMDDRYVFFIPTQL